MKLNWQPRNKIMLIWSVNIYIKKRGYNIQWWKDSFFYKWCWGNSTATCKRRCKELTHWKKHLHWERLKAGGEGDNREWDGWMASLIQWTWVWASSGSWWWTESRGVMQSMGSQRVRHDSATELNWHLLFSIFNIF